MVILFPGAIPTLNCEERYFAKFFQSLKISVLPYRNKSNFSKQIHYTSGNKSMIRDKETQRLKMPGLKLLQRNYINEEARKMTKVRHLCPNLCFKDYTLFSKHDHTFHYILVSRALYQSTATEICVTKSKQTKAKAFLYHLSLKTVNSQ